MSTGNVRRAQLVSPFGVGAMSVLVNGTSVITAGLDHWYDIDEGNQLALEEYREHDWRLEARLRVAEFRLPPDYRHQAPDHDRRNVRLTVPVLRFPCWSFCLYCKRLERSTLTMQDRVECPDPGHSPDDAKTKGGKKRGGRRPRMSQVPFVVICSGGHIDDFPFAEWVHRSHDPACRGVLRLTSQGGGGLEGQVVTCGFDAAGKRVEGSGCGLKRSLRGITAGHQDAKGERTTLTDQLESREAPFFCVGSRPWLAQSRGLCGLPIRGALRAAGNVYFPKVESSIYLPRHEGAVSAEMHELMRRPDVGPVMRVLNAVPGDVSAEQLRVYLPSELVAAFSDEELMAGFNDLLGVGATRPEADEVGDAELLTGDDEWRFPEFERIRDTPRDDYLSGSDPGMHVDLRPFIGRVRSIDVLRETRALRGFTRVRDDVLRLSSGKALLRRHALSPGQDWLPAYVVKGEGIYIELDPDRIAVWERRPDVKARAQKIADHYGHVVTQRGLQSRSLSPRFVLLHTLGHLLINELVFACGYSSASLRERLYVSEAADRQMAGLLIYTAAGDSEGTMGGLVRMARETNLRDVLVSAVTDARWCSTDPVCMDSGEKGQGPDSCNLAACHGCALLPETSCEEFNRFLDRGLVIGTFADPELGYFSDLVEGQM
jgi:Domain of unknown function (DUF1998)